MEWPLRGDAQFAEHLGFDAANTRGTAVGSGNGTPPAAGSWVTLGTTTRATRAITVCYWGVSASGAGGFIDIGVGATTVVVVEKLLFWSYWGDAQVPIYMVTIPVNIPAGTVVKARHWTDVSFSSRTAYVSCLAHANSFLPGGPFNVWTTHGISGSSGTSIDPGGTTHTKGSWTQLVSSTARTYRGLFAMFGNLENETRTDARWAIDIGIGAASSEVVVVPNLALAGSDDPDTINPIVSPLLDVHIPRGSRIAVRAQCSITDATDRLFGIALYGGS